MALKILSAEVRQVAGNCKRTRLPAKAVVRKEGKRHFSTTISPDIRAQRLGAIGADLRAETLQDAAPSLIEQHS
jgi:hypothetical protein